MSDEYKDTLVGQITVDVKQSHPRLLYMTQLVGEGSFGDEKFTIHTLIPGGSIMVKIEREDRQDERLIVTMGDVVKAILRLREEKKNGE